MKFRCGFIVKSVKSPTGNQLKINNSNECASFDSVNNQDNQYFRWSFQIPVPQDLFDSLKLAVQLLIFNWIGQLALDTPIIHWLILVLQKPLWRAVREIFQQVNFPLVLEFPLVKWAFQIEISKDSDN